MENSIPSRTSSRLGALQSVFVWVSTVFAIFAFLVREVIDGDTWWQVAIGRDILGKLAVPFVDNYALASMGNAYHDSHWFFQVVIALFDRVAGMEGVSVFMVLVWSVALFCCYLSTRKWQALPAACLMVFIVTLSVNDRFTPRPDIVTCLMISLYYFLLQDCRGTTKRGVFLLTVLQIIWTNSHGLFVIGPFMVGCVWCGEVLGRIKGKEAEEGAATRLLIFVLLASLVNPYGIGAWKYAVLLAREGGASEVFAKIPELAATFGPVSRSTPDFWFFLLILIGYFLVLAFSMCKGQKKVNVSRFLMTIFLFLAALTGFRNIPLYTLVAVPFIAETAALNFPSLAVPRKLGRALVVLMLLCCWYPLSGKFYRDRNYPQRFGVGASGTVFSVSFPRFLKRINFTAPLYNSNYIGGFLHYYGFTPLIDGRWEVYDEATRGTILSAHRNNQLWRQVVSNYGIEGVALQHLSGEGLALVPKLYASPEWELIFYNHSISFWVHSNSLKRNVSTPVFNLAALSEPLKRVEDYLSLITFLKSINEFSFALSLIDPALAFGQLDDLFLQLKVGILRGLNAPEDEINLTIKRLNEQYPENVFALNEMALLSFNQGDIAGAEKYLRTAMDLAPQEQFIKDNLEILQKIKQSRSAR